MEQTNQAILGPSIVLFVLCANQIFTTNGQSQQKPNIILIIADDMGFNDVSFHGLDQFQTPNIDALAYNGIILNQFYTASACTPSRGALMSSKFPIYTGVDSVILESSPWGFPLDIPILPQHLRNAGYETVIVGKWHLGFFEKEYTPTFRGFDKHSGYWQGYQDYITHDVRETFGFMHGYDMRENMDVAWNARGVYSTDYFTEKAIQAINSHDNQKPLFLVMSHLAPHGGHPLGHLKAPAEEIQKYSYISNSGRCLFAAVMSKLDQSVGDIFLALDKKNMLENSIVMFFSDNGAPPKIGVHPNNGSNYPFRGFKLTEFDGGVRCAAAIWSPLLKNQQRVSNQLIHIVDLMPTLYSAAGMNVSELGDIDGIDLWESLNGNVESTNVRTEFPLNIHQQFGLTDNNAVYGAIRSGDWKFVRSSPYLGIYDGWGGDSGRSETENKPGYEYKPENVLNSVVGSTIAKLYSEQRNKENNHQWTPLTVDKILQLRKEATVTCKESQQKECKPRHSPCLINIKEDPCERYDLADVYPDVFQVMQTKFDEYRKKQVKSLTKPADYRANPKCFNGAWTPWLNNDTTQNKEFEVVKRDNENKPNPVSRFFRGIKQKLSDILERLRNYVNEIWPRYCT